MNERILKLAEQAGYHINGGKIFIRTTSEDITACQQKFAEMIVRECASLTDQWPDTVRQVMSRQIKQHFGVEE